MILSDRLAKIKMTRLDGRPFSLNQYVGQPIFLNFWATWCAPCVSEMQAFERLHQEYGGDIVFLAVSNEEISKIKAFGDQRDISFTLARLDIGYLEAYVVKLPTTLLIDSKGNIVHEEEGSRNWNSEESENLVKSIL